MESANRFEDRDTLGISCACSCRARDTVVVAVGGCGLAASISAAGPDHVRLISVEPKTACCLAAALQAGSPVPVEVVVSLRIRSAQRSPGRFPGSCWPGAASRSRSATRRSSQPGRTRWERCELAVEPGAAASSAAVQSGACGVSPGERAAVVVCGANTDPADLSGDPAREASG